MYYDNLMAQPIWIDIYDINQIEIYQCLYLHIIMNSNLSLIIDHMLKDSRGQKSYNLCTTADDMDYHQIHFQYPLHDNDFC